MNFKLTSSLVVLLMCGTSVIAQADVARTTTARCSEAACRAIAPSAVRLSEEQLGSPIPPGPKKPHGTPGETQSPPPPPGGQQPPPPPPPPTGGANPPPPTGGPQPPQGAGHSPPPPPPGGHNQPPPPHGGPTAPPQGPGGQYQPPPQGGQYGPPPPPPPAGKRRWGPGDRVPDGYRDGRNIVPDWRGHNLPPPPHGYRWLCLGINDCFLVDNGWVIRETRSRDDNDRRWRQRYSRTWSYNDDIYYRECRSRPDPAGILIGGIIGGLIGHAADGRGSGGTIAGIIVGATVGAALTRDMDCEDRSYAYRVYFDALNGGRPGNDYRWQNPRNGHHGEFRIRSYYYDNSGFYCANYRHTAWTSRSRRVNGTACRQPDGAWTFLN